MQEILHKNPLKYPRKKRQYIIRLVYISIIFFVLWSNCLFAQSKKQEFRAIWIATVANIDWPSSPYLNSDEQKKEIINILNRHKENHCNAIILQIRPCSDAIYESKFEPWSKYLTGTQGKAPEPYYDPLRFWITESHKRGMEMHAWFNPYRIKQNLEDSLAENHVFKNNPDWGWTYGNRVYFEPGNPEVWEFLTKVVVDVVSRYDIDAVHFDDYFYPYRIASQEIPDSTAFKKYGKDFYPDNKDAWRRHNVDTIIQQLNIAIKNTKPWVKFGISPFGVWRNSNQDPKGSETKAGTTNYDVLYADILKWQNKGWIDYSMPQLYWRDDHPVADFSTLAYWWNDYSYGRAMYFGLAPYRIDRNSKYKLWRREKHFLRQIELLRTLQNVHGFGYFSSKHFFRKDLKRLNKKIQKRYCEYPAIVPKMTWIDNKAPLPPKNLKAEGNKITWSAPDAKHEMDKARFYVVYKYPLKQNRCLKDARYIVDITGTTEYIIDKKGKKAKYRISSLDRLNNESQLSNILIFNE